MLTSWGKEVTQHKLAYGADLPRACSNGERTTVYGDVLKVISAQHRETYPTLRDDDGVDFSTANLRCPCAPCGTSLLCARGHWASEGLQGGKSKKGKSKQKGKKGKKGKDSK